MSRAPLARPARRFVAIVVAWLVAAVVSTVVAAPASAQRAKAQDPTYRPPVDAPVVDPFRPPTTPYGPGNRGLEYRSPVGEPVRAAADGRVTFAGLVAGSRHVTVLHGDGLRTTVSYLATIDVVVGQRVRQGDPLGTAGDRLLFTARNGDAYLDPAALFQPGPPRVRLVPFDVPPGAGGGGEHSAIRQLIGFGTAAGSALWGAVSGAAGDAVALGYATGDWLEAQAPDLFRLALHYAPLVVPPLRALRLGVIAVQGVRAAWEIARRACTPADTPVAVPVERRIAVLVAGLGSTSGRASISDLDVGALGYEDPDVVRFSYAGGRVPGSGASFRGAPTTTYGAADTQQDLRTSGRRLADLVEAVAAEQPDVPIDLLAHSQGGLVARLALLELVERHGSGWLDRVGLLATLGTPHGGADLATAAALLGTAPLGQGALDTAGTSFPDLDRDSPATRQLAETSALIQHLDERPIPATLHALSIAARGDVVVPVPRARLEGAPEVVVPLMSPTAHADLPGDPRTTRELGLALAGAPPTCVSFGAALLDQAAGAAISQVEDSAAAAAWGFFAAMEAKGPLMPDAPAMERVTQPRG